MLTWKFEPGIEDGLKEIGTQFVKVMQTHGINMFVFNIYGFNHVEVAIVKTKQGYEAKIVDEDGYEPHYIEDEKEYDEWRQKRLYLQEHGFIQNETVEVNMSEEMKLEVWPISEKLISIWKQKRKNEIDHLEFRFKGKIITHHYHDERGIIIMEEKEDYWYKEY